MQEYVRSIGPPLIESILFFQAFCATIDCLFDDTHEFNNIEKIIVLFSAVLFYIMTTPLEYLKNIILAILIKKFLFYASILYESVFLLLISNKMRKDLINYNSIIKKIRSKFISEDEIESNKKEKKNTKLTYRDKQLYKKITLYVSNFLSFYYQKEIIFDEEYLYNQLEHMKTKEDKLTDEEKFEKMSTAKKIEYLNDNFFGKSKSEGMFLNSRKTKTFVYHQRYYRFIVSTIIILLQLYSILLPFISNKISTFEFIVYLFVKFLFIEKIISFNFIDCILNRKRIFESLKMKKMKKAFWFTFILYIISFILFIVAYIICNFLFFARVDQLNYIENNTISNKYRKQIFNNTPSYCSAGSRIDGSLNIVDLSVLATLPRLYDVTSKGKCYLKPSKRGIFNSTMKYIFGDKYEYDNIRIYCTKLTQDPILVISSDKILKTTLSHFLSENVTLLKPPKFIHNSNYFYNFTKANLTNQKSIKLYETYEECISSRGNNECEIEWDNFTQHYWSKEFSAEYSELKGFERYQLSIDKDTIFQPRFITSDGQYWSGTHYIVGGSFEDVKGVGYYLETIFRKYIPNILESILPFYSIIKRMTMSVFFRIEEFNRHLFYTDITIKTEMKAIENLLKHFNFTSKSIFLIGHKTSGTTFKEVTYQRNIESITFDALEIESNLNKIDKTNLQRNAKYPYSNTNIYSKKFIFKSRDIISKTNGILPHGSILSNVYEIACSISSTCSTNEKYLSYCKQVVSQHK